MNTKDSKESKSRGCKGKKRGRRFFAAALTAVLAASLTAGIASTDIVGRNIGTVTEAQAAQGSGGLYENMYWEISDSGVMTLRPSGGRAYARIADNRYTNGQVEGGWPWKQYADKITEIKIQGTIGSSPNVDLKNMFSDLPNVTKIDISGFNFATDAQGNVVAGRHTIRNLDEMFANSPKLVEIVGLDVLAHPTVTSTQRMFKGCTALTTADFNALDMSNVTMAVGMFQNCSSLTELDLSDWTNDGKMQQMQDLVNGCSSLKTFTLNNPGFETRVVNTATNAGNYKATGASGAQTQRMFDSCDALEELDLSNITISTWKAPIEGDGQQNTFIRSIGGTNSDGLPNLKILKMNNIKLPGLKAGVLGGELVYHKESLEEFQFGGDIDIDDSINDSTHDAAYKSGLEEIVDKLIEGCRNLKVVDLSGWDTSDIKAQGAKTDGTYTTFGFKELIENGSLQKVIAEDVIRADGSAKKTKIWMHYEDPADNGTTISEYDISNTLDQITLDNLHIDWRFNFTPDGSYFSLDNNPDDAHTLHGVLGGDSGYLSGGTYVVGDPQTQPEPFEGKIPKTYYLVNGSTGSTELFVSTDGGSSYTPLSYDSNWTSDGEFSYYKEIGDYHIQYTGDGGWRIYTKNFSMTEWGNKTSNNEASLDGDVRLKFVYRQAATDVNGKVHDVVVDINSVTFKDMDLIPTLSPDYKLDPYGVNPWIDGSSYTVTEGGTTTTHTFNRTDTDLKSLAGTKIDSSGNVVYENGKPVYDPSQTYTRYLMSSDYEGLHFWNQMYKTSQAKQNKDPDKLYSKGSGTYIDYDITIDDALPDTSVLFWVGDLDVAHSQNWDMSLTNPSNDRMLSDAYGPGSEGIVLGSGNDLNTLVFANNTGLERYDYDSTDYSQSTPDANGNYIVGTATDPNTSWSRFYVRADAQGANYIWTSGISCKTDILGTPGIKHEDLPPVYVIPEAIKLVNGATPSGDFMDAFSFNLEKATEIDPVEYTYFYNNEDKGENGQIVNHTVNLDNLADDSVETRNNSYGVVPFSEREYQAPGSTQGSQASDHDPFGQHDYNEHIAKAYVYRITENEPENNSDGIMTYNKDRVVYYLKVIVSDPKTDLEMYKGTRADVTIGTYHYAEGATGSARFAPNHDAITWGETKTIWSSDAIWTEQTTADGQRIFIDASGKKFYRNNGEFLSYPNDDQMSVAQYEQTDVTVDFEGTAYPVMQDKDGVRYIAVPDGSNTLYLDADNPDRNNPLREANADSVFPTEDDQPVAAKKQVDKDGTSYTVQIDVHGKTYIKVDDKYYAVTVSETGGTVGDELTVEDAKFNPHTDDRILYENKTATLGGTSYVVKTDALGTEYFEVPGDPTSTYYKPDGTPLSAGIAGSVSPSASDKAVTSDNSEEANLVVNGHKIYEDTNNVKYYTDNGNFYSVLGTLLMKGIDVEPSTSDQPVKENYDIRQDADGNLFYKGEGAYNIDGTYTTKYYNAVKNTDGTYTIDGSEYTMPGNLLDTSEAMVVGSFGNVVKQSEIEIENKTEDGKAGTFTFEIEFDNNFEPTNIAFDAVTPLVDDSDNHLQFEKVGDKTYKFTLTEGQKVTIKNVPFQTGYTVTRIAESNGWEVTSADDYTSATSVTKKVTQERYLTDGSVNPDWDNSHVFVNRFTELVVKKVVEGIETDKEFNFTGTAKITGLQPNEEFSYGYMQEANDHEFKTARANENGEASISLDAFKLQDQENKEDIVLVLPKGANVTITEAPDFDYETTWAVDDGEAQAVTDGATGEITMDEDKKVVTIVNAYKATGTWYPYAYKILDGRPLERDQFEFEIKAGTGSPMQDYEQENHDQLGEPLYYKSDKETKATLADGGLIYNPVRTDEESWSTRLFDNKVDVQRSRGSFTQEVDKKAGNAVYADMGTADLYGSVLFGPITYTKDDLKEQKYEDAPDWIKALNYIIWTKDGKTYSSGETIPNDATANYSVFDYTISEKKDNNKDYGVTTYDETPETVSVVVAESTTGPLTVKAYTGENSNYKEITPITGGNPILFNNEYLAKGEVKLKATKKIDGRDAFGRETFSGEQEFTFELTAVTENTPLPGTAPVSKTIKPGAATTAEIDFGTITFTSGHFTDGDATDPKFIATRNADGLYERTFIYKITETSPTATDANGMSAGVDRNDTTDTRASILVAVTVTEDKYGNMVVTRVNSADTEELKGDIYKNQSINLTVDNKGEKKLDTGNYTAKSTVGAGTLYNTYQASGTATIKATKKLENGTLNDNMFYFEILGKDSDGNFTKVMDTKPNKADGTIEFNAINYNLVSVRKQAEAGICTGPTTEDETTANEWVYIYTIKELVPADDAKAEGITYDDTLYYAQVTVTDDGKGNLTTAVKYYSDAACETELTDGIKFTNTAEVTATIKAKKNVEGADWDNTMNFWFSLAAEGGTNAEGEDIPESDVPMPDITRKAASKGNDTVSWEISNLQPGSTYNYTVNEISNMGSADPNEWSLDTDTHEVEVAVDGDGKVTVTYDKTETGNPNAELFTNTKKGSNLNIHAIKQVTDSSSGTDNYWRNGDTYTLVLEAAGKRINPREIDPSDVDKQPMPSGSKGRKKEIEVGYSDDHNANFGVIAFDESVDDLHNLNVNESITYVYYLYELIPDDAVNAAGTKYSNATDEEKSYGGFVYNGVEYSSKKGRAEVNVRRETDGLHSFVYYYDELSGDFTPAVIRNIYKAEAEADIAAKKVLNGANLSDFTTTIEGSSEKVSAFSFTLYEEDGSTVAKDKAGKDIKNIRPSLTDGKTPEYTLSFDQSDITDILSGSAAEVTKTYILKEDAGSKSGVDYDSAEHKIIVTLKLNGDGTITATPSAGDGTTDSGVYATVTNTYAPEAEQTFSVSKLLWNRPITRNGFDFTLEGLGTVDEINKDDYAATIDGIEQAAVPMPENAASGKATTHVGATTSDYSPEGQADFDTITYTMDNSLKNDDNSYASSRIFVYRITEDQGANRAIDYMTGDKFAYYAFVTVENNTAGDGFKATPTYVRAVKDGNTWSYTDITPDSGGDSLSPVLSGMPFTNIYEAVGRASVAPIKQIIGRDWTGSDEFEFTIKPYESVADDVYSHIGGGEYVDPEGVPLPGNTPDRIASYEDYDKLTNRKAHADEQAWLDYIANLDLQGNGTVTKVTGKATINGRDVGNGEHFAEYSATNPDGFKAITYTDDMLTWDASDGILKGTYFYEITENIPDTATATIGTKEYTYAEALQAVEVETISQSDVDNADWVAGGFTYDGRSFYARVDVTDNRTGGLTTHIYYFSNPDDLNDITKADGATPVFQNTYDVDTDFELPITKTIDGRAWESEDTFGFTIDRMNTAPLPSDAEGATADDNTITIDDSTTAYTSSFKVPVNMAANLTSKTTREGQFTYSDGKNVPKGVWYNIFRYSVTEKDAGETYKELTYQADPVYAEVQAVDDLKGGIDTKITYYSDDAYTKKIGDGTKGTFTNTYDTYADNPAQILVKKEVVDSAGNAHTWASADTYTFTIEALGDAPVTRKFSPDTDDLVNAPDQTSIEIKRDSKESWYTTGADGSPVAGDAVSQAAAVSIPIKMSDLKTGTDDKPVDTVFVYKITEQAGSIHGVRYNTAPIYTQVTAKPQADGTIKLEYAYFTDEDCTLVYANTDAAGKPGADGAGNGIVLSNTFGATDIKVEKDWNDGLDEDDPDDASAIAARPQVSIRLTQTIDGVTTTLDSLPADTYGNKAALVDKDGNNIDYIRRGVVAADKLPATFENLPAFTADGKGILYGVTEDDPAGYRCTDTDTSVPGVVTFTNTLLTSVPVTKVWNDGTDTGDRPETVIVGLIREGTSYPVDFKVVHSNESARWTDKFDNLLAYDSNGEPIIYSVRELGIPEVYSSDLIPDNKGGYVITNTKLTDITLSKTWVGGAGANVEFKLYRSTAPSDASAITKDSEGNARWTPDDTWEEVEGAAYTFPASLFDYSEQGSTRKYTLTGLEAYDKYGKQYTYRVYEEESQFFKENQTSDLEITNTNEYTAVGHAKPNVVKELDGRPWLDRDKFWFKIDAVNITDENGTVVNVDSRPAPLPESAVTYTDMSKEQIGAIGRDVSFGDITFTNEDMLNDDGSAATKRNFNYIIYEVADESGTSLVDVTDNGYLKGITYAGSIDQATGKWSPVVHELRIEVVDNGDGTLSTTRYWDGSDDASAVPVYTNTYSSESVGKMWIEKNIHRRAWTDTDEFTFTITGVSGASLNIGGSDTRDSYTTRPMRLSDTGDLEALSGELVAMGIEGNTYSGKALIDGEGYFIYEITEDKGAISDLTYDEEAIYMRVHVTDNWDGTLSFEEEFFEDAGCTKPITGHKVWIKEDDRGGHLLSAQEAAEAEGMSEDERKEAGYKQVETAYFTNTLATTIPVKKVWDGQPVEDVTVLLERVLLEPKADGSELTEEEIKEAVSKLSDSDWTPVTRLEIPRGDFVKDTGEPIANEADGISSNTYYIDNMPMYVEQDGKSMRAVYRVDEEDASDAYETGYGRIRGGIYQDGERLYTQKGGTLVITNKTTTTNEAHIAAVKQFLGRQWLNDDDFTFSLKPKGRAVYNSDGTIKEIQPDTSIPMPQTGTEGSGAGVTAKAHATKVDDIVDVDGGYERLAKFGAIKYTADDLVFSDTEKRLAGDFYYTMTELVPNGANDNGDETYTDDKGITYKVRDSEVHVRVRENRTNELSVYVYYDQTDLNDPSTGTQFTPVFTNVYDTHRDFNAGVYKYVMGRNWKKGETFDFVVHAIGGAPMEPAVAAEFPDAAHDTGTDADIEAALSKDLFAHTADGGMIARLTVPDDMEGKSDYLEHFMPTLRFSYSDLNKVVSSPDELKDSHGDPVPVGMRYAQFTYGINEADMSSGDLKIDPDTEYIRVTISDNKGNGELDVYWQIFADRLATDERRHASLDDEPAIHVTFVNQVLRDIEAVKTWKGYPAADATVILQYKDAAGKWVDYESYTFDKNAEGEEKEPVIIDGVELPVTEYRHTFTGLPVYLEGSNEKDKDLDDMQLEWRIIETQMPGITTTYGENEDKKDADVTEDPELKHPDDPQGPTVEDLDKELYVTNTDSAPLDPAEASVSVVKDIKGREWLNSDSFTFKLEPEGKAVYDTQTGEITGKDTSDETKAEMPAGTTATATNDVDPEYKLSDSQRQAMFDIIKIPADQLTLAGDVLKGDFYYTMTEVKPEEGAVENMDYDTSKHEVHIHVERRGDTLTAQVNYDDKPVGGAVPVYTNRYDGPSTSVAVTKTWVNEAGEATTPIENVTVNVRRFAVYTDEDGKYYEDAGHKKEISLPDNIDEWEPVDTHTFMIGDFTDGNSVTYTFADLETDELKDGELTGRKYIYRVREATESGAYTSVYIKDGNEDPSWTTTDTVGAPVTVKNTLVASNTANIAAVKELMGRDWDDTKDSYKFTLAPVSGELGDGTKVESGDVPMPDNKKGGTAEAVTDNEEKVGENERLARFGGITYTLEDLGYNSADGRMEGDFYYTMTEVTPTSGVSEDGFITYDKSEHKVHVQVHENRTGKLEVTIAYDETTEGDVTTGTQFTPVYVNTYEKVEVPVRSLWLGDTDADGTVKPLRPNKLTVKLQSKTGEGDWTDVEGNTIELTQAGNWAGIFDDLPAKSATGEAVSYRAVEIQVPDGYSPQDSKAVLGATVIVNQYGVTSITGTKEWRFDTASHNNSSEVTLKISRSADGGATWETLSADADYHVDWSGENDSTFTVRGLKKFADGGETEYTFKVEEADVPAGYEVSYGEGNAIINTKHPGPVEVTVTKLWDDEDNKDKYRLSTQELAGKLTLLADGEPVKDPEDETKNLLPEVTDNKDGTYTAVWKAVPDRTDKGFITYTVVEAAVDKYATRYTDAKGIEVDAAPSGGVIVNKHDPDPEMITVTYDPDNGEDKKETEIEKGANEPGAPADPTKEGFTFGGWERAQDDDGNVTYKAKWIPIEKITVKRDPKNGEAESSTEIERTENEPAQPGDPYREGYRFLGWDRVQNEDGNVTYTARWDKIPVGEAITITYKDGDNIKQQKDIQRGENEPAAPEDPSKEGYKFTGWKRTQDPDTGDVTYEATWEEIEKITVIYIDPSKPESEQVIQTETIERGADERPAPADPTRDGFTFVGWKRDTGSDGNVTYTAQWKQDPVPETIKVVYIDPATGEKKVEATIERTQNEPAQPADPTRDGYKFTGWQRVQDDETGDVTYTARWEKIPEGDTVKITYIDDSKPKEDQVIQENSIERGTNEPDAPPAPTREGYRFVGWIRTTDEDGNVTYTANWEEIPQITITYDPDNGEDKKVDTIQRGEDEPKAPDDPTKEGYTFGGWERSTNEDGNVTYKAKWLENPPEPEEITDISVMKKWDDDDNRDGRRTEVKVALMIKSGDELVPAKDAQGADIPELTLNEAVNWSGRFENLPAKDAEGKIIEYAVTETTSPEGYTAKVEGSADKGYTVTNTYIPAITTIRASKEWKDEPETVGEALRTDVTLHLFGNIDGRIVYDAGEQVIKKDETEAKWQDIPAYHDGKPMTWTVIEDAVAGYTTEIKVDEADSNRFIVTNKYIYPVVPEDPTVDVNVTKEWQDDEDTDGKRPAKITYELWSKVGTAQAEKVDEQEVTKDTDWKYTWEELPATVEAGDTVYVKKDGSGEAISEAQYNALSDAEKALYEAKTDDVPILYSVKEAEVPGYESMIVAAAPGEFKAINYHRRETISLNVRKAWSDGDDVDGIRPAHISVLLKADGVEVNKGVLTADGNWEITFAGLPKFVDGKVGQEIKYTVEEISVDGYAAAYTGAGTEDDPLVITNTYTPAEKITLMVTKEWKDEDGDTSARKPAVFHLIQVVDGARKQLGAEYDKTIPVDAKDQGLVLTWSDLKPVIDGKAVTYTVVEDPIEGYTTSMSDGKTEGSTISITVTNTKDKVEPKPEPETITITHDDGMGHVTTDTIERGSNEPAQPADPVREGFTFAGWDRSEDEKGNVTYKARWIENPKPGEITITYKDGDTTVKAETITRGDDEPAQPEDLVKAGFIFGGWERSVDAEGNVTYTAKWVADVTDMLRVLYVDPMAEGESANPVIGAKKYATQEEADKAAADQTDAPEDPSHEGYTFTGWMIGKDEFGDYVLVAKYNEEIKPEKTTVTFIDPQSGEMIIKSVELEDGQSPDDVERPEDPKHENMQFVGWEKAQDASGNWIYAAKFAPDCRGGQVKYWVMYVDSDGKIIYMDKTDVHEGEDDPQPPADPTKEGKKFAGWKLTVDEFGNKVYSAIWIDDKEEPETYWVTYVDPDGKTVYLPKIAVNKGEAEPEAPTDPVKEGFTFEGWDRSVDADGNVTYTAKWKEIIKHKTHWITYVDPDGTVYLEKVEITEGDPEPEAPADPVRTGYKFDGWKRSVDADGNVTYTAKWIENKKDSVDPDNKVDPKNPVQPDNKVDPKNPVQPDNKSSGSAGAQAAAKSGSAATGDSNGTVVWIVIGAAALAAITGVAFGIKRRKRNE